MHVKNINLASYSNKHAAFLISLMFLNSLFKHLTEAVEYEVYSDLNKL